MTAAALVLSATLALGDEDPAATLAGLPPPSANVQLDDELYGFLLVHAIVDALRRVLCVDVPPSSLRCAPTLQEPPAEEGS